MEGRRCVLRGQWGFWVTTNEISKIRKIIEFQSL